MLSLLGGGPPDTASPTPGVRAPSVLRQWPDLAELPAFVPLDVAGPFVMNAEAEDYEAIRSDHAGRMGSIPPEITRA